MKTQTKLLIGAAALIGTALAYKTYSNSSALSKSDKRSNPMKLIKQINKSLKEMKSFQKQLDKVR